MLAMKIRSFAGLVFTLLLTVMLLVSCSTVEDTIVFSGSLNGYLDACG